MLKENLIVFTGPECSGKTTWSTWYANKIGAKWVPEYAREYLNKLNRDYVKADLLEIAKGQYNLIQDAIENNGRVVADTDLLTIKIWSEVKYGEVDQEIIDLWQKQIPQRYILTYPDITWKYDPLRESPNDREGLFKIYHEMINHYNFQILEGEKRNREEILNAL